MTAMTHSTFIPTQVSALNTRDTPLTLVVCTKLRSSSLTVIWLVVLSQASARICPVNINNNKAKVYGSYCMSRKAGLPTAQ